MSTLGTTVPTLVAAFVFGIVVNAASAALFLHVSSHGSTAVRDGQRLVLTTFLLSAALWAQSDFISIAIDPAATSSCQVGIIFSTLFDQLARFSVEQYLLWAINKGTRSGVQQMALQALVVARFVVGCVFVGFSRPQFDPVCVPMSSIMPVAIVTIALDVVLVFAMAIMAIMSGLLSDAREGGPDAGRSKSVLLVIVAFAIWTATSIVMLLGMSSATLLLRTLLPAVGLLILVFVVTACNGTLTMGTTRTRTRQPDSPGIRNITTGHSISTEASSDYPPSRFEDIKRSEIMAAFEQPREAPQPQAPQMSSNFSRPGVMMATVDASQPAAFAPAVSAVGAAAAVSATRKVSSGSQGPKGKRSLLDLRGGPAAGRGGKMSISNPILEANGDQNPLNKIATISLEEAAKSERERRANDLQRDSALIAKRPAPQPPSMSTEEAMKRSVSFRRKEVASVSSQPPMPSMSSLEPMPMAMTSSAQLSPGVEELRRRSPRQPPVDSRMDQPMRPMSTAVSSIAMPAAPSPTMPLPPLQQSLPELLAQDLIDEQNLREEMDQMDDQPQQMNFTVEPSQAANGFIIQPAIYAPSRPVRAENDLPAPPTGVDTTVRRPDIRPSRQLPKTPTEPAPVVSVSALQRRPTNGLPGNPRAMAMKALSNEANAGRQQTVMFMNNIVYDNPETVQDIINDANTKEQTRRSTQSIVHRPRPIPRHLEKDRAIFPAEPSPNLAGHRRSKSGGSIIGRKSILMSNPGSPTQLPPLPMPPKNMSTTMNLSYKMERPSADRPQPNSTKSMTFDEKMTLLFPTPPSGEAMPRRRSSVPEMPSLPLDYMPIILSPTEGYDRDNRMSQSTTRTGRTSIKTENILEVNELPRRSSDHSEGRELSMALSDAPMQPPAEANSTAAGGRKRASSPVLPTARDSTATVSTSGRTHDDATTNWGSVYSPVVAVPIPANRQMARTTYINAERNNGNPNNTRNNVAPAEALMDNSEPLLPLLPATTYNDGRRRAISPPLSDADDEQTLLQNEQKSEKRESQWHRRVGDKNTLSFSDRKERTRSRKMPPPTPLLLNPPSTKNPVIVKAAEPSPLESPEQALAYIQEQLRRYEEPNLAVTAEETPTRRIALLDNIEKEMDMQAGHWQEMQHDLRHDSLSTVQTLSPAAESRRQSVLSTHNIAGAAVQQQQQEQQHQKEVVPVNIGADRRAARRSRIQSGTLAKSTTDPSVLSPVAASTASPLRNVTYNKQTPFANAVIDLGPLGSPTPPDSDEDGLDLRLHRPFDTFDAANAALVDSVVEKLSQPPVQEKKASLWTQTTKPATMTTTTLLWTPAPAVSSRESAIFITLSQLPAHAPIKKSKVAKKSLSGPLPIESVNLWTKNASQATHATAAYSNRGLWTARVQVKSMPVEQHSSVAVAEADLSEEELLMQKMQDLELEMAGMEATQEQRRSSDAQKAPRPLTQRPPRRTKRVTMLPDILESPKPLPDKRGTLGIFQFPWGERSDTAKPPSLPSRGGPFGAMPGTMASGGGQLNAALEARSRQLEADEYSSSFFDDYDDEDYEEEQEEDDQGFDDDASGSDDGFDENTLWEIASLLKTEQVPSKLSMFPPPLSADSVMSDYMTEMPLDANSETIDEILVDLENGSRTDSQHDSQLWTATEKGVKTLSMAQPDEETWKSYDTVNQGATLRSKPRTSEPAQVETSQLWNRPAPASGKVIKSLPANPRANLWAAAEQKKLKQQQQQQAADNKMWTPRMKKTVAAKSGKAHLFDKDVAAAAKMESAVVRTTDKEPAALNMPRTPRAPSRAPLEKLMSSSLWAAPPQKKANKMWAPRTKKAVVAKATLVQLFNKDAAAAAKMESAVTRTTDKEPAALNMPRTPRTPSRAPLEKLMSSSLWTAASDHTSQLWASMPVPKVRAKGHLFDREVAAVENMRKPTRTTTKEPAALDMIRAPRSLLHLPALHLESINLWSVTATSAHHVQIQPQYNWILAKDLESLPLIIDDTIPASNVGVKQNTWWEKMKAAAGMSATAPATRGVAPLDTIKMAEAEIDSLRMALKTTPLLPPGQQQQQRPQRWAVSSGEWKDALQEAVAASYPWLQRRISATPSQWQAELDRAMARSYPFDAARQHPALAASSPSTFEASAYDVNKVHPVFFVQAADEKVDELEAPAEIVIQLVQSSPVVATQQQQSEADAAYHAHIMAIENQALARLQALESGSHGVVLRY
ncbi:hypothetical protein SCUCBS95973_000611 [Sporothrix curviconia]|uniref:Uncharacterized protein n=1 Tax=Sporothrix curviconia TaxID=1260050 RepID=A0ABP0ARQ3_9PEZI